jgi:hypothetical protein
MSLESDGGMILTGENRRTRRKTCPSATLSATNPTWIDPGVNPGLRGERPATNDLNHGTVVRMIIFFHECTKFLLKLSPEIFIKASVEVFVPVAAHAFFWW